MLGWHGNWRSVLTSTGVGLAFWTGSYDSLGGSSMLGHHGGLKPTYILMRPRAQIGEEDGCGDRNGQI